MVARKNGSEQQWEIGKGVVFPTPSSTIFSKTPEVHNTKAVRDTSSNDTSSTATLRRKFWSNYQFVEK